VYSRLQAFAAKPLSQVDIVRHTDLTNRMACAFGQHIQMSYCVNAYGPIVA
jgi:hypothetical protein